ncbi:MAG: hypothetical protein ACJ73S_06605 [Mycobacteriales bacterium]
MPVRRVMTPRTVTAAVLLCLLATACGSHAKTAKPHLGKGAGPDTSGPTAEPKAGTFTYQQLTIRPPKLRNDGQQAVLVAYQNFWKALYDAGNDPLNGIAGLEAVTTDPAKRTFVTTFHQLAVQKQTKKGAVVLSPTITDVTDTSATITDCADFSQSRIYNSQGKPVDSVDAPTTSVEVKLTKVNGAWFVSSYDEPGRGCVQRKA